MSNRNYKSVVINVSRSPREGLNSKAEIVSVIAGQNSAEQACFPSTVGSESLVEVTFEEAHPIALRAAESRANAAVKSGAIHAKDRDDLIQNVLIAVWHGLKKFDPSRGCLRTYIEWIATAQVASAVRSASRQAPHDSIEEKALPPLDLVYEDLELGIDIRKLLSQLDPHERQLALLLMEHTPAEAARALGVPTSSLHDRIVRLRSHFVASGLQPNTVKRSPAAELKREWEGRNAA